MVDVVPAANYRRGHIRNSNQQLGDASKSILTPSPRHPASDIRQTSKNANPPRKPYRRTAIMILAMMIMTVTVTMVQRYLPSWLRCLASSKDYRRPHGTAAFSHYCRHSQPYPHRHKTFRQYQISTRGRHPHHHRRHHHHHHHHYRHCRHLHQYCHDHRRHLIRGDGGLLSPRGLQAPLSSSRKASEPELAH